MVRFLIDENLPRSLAPRLRAEGHDAEDVRDIGLRGVSDDVVRRYTAVSVRVLLTGDVVFGNLVRFPVGSHPGVVLVRLPNEMPACRRVDTIIDALRSIAWADLSGNIVVITANRVRIRRGR